MNKLKAALEATFVVGRAYNPAVDDCSLCSAADLSKVLFCTFSEAYYCFLSRSGMTFSKKEFRNVIRLAFPHATIFRTQYGQKVVSGIAINNRNESLIIAPILSFIKTNCDLGPNANCEASKMYNAWNEWSERNGVESIRSLQSFTRAILACRPELKAQREGSKRIIVGIGLK